jgi:hypothetical protein
MSAIDTRLRALERIAVRLKPIEPIRVFIQPEEGHPRREAIQAEIDALEGSGRQVIVVIRASAQLSE